MTSLAAAFADRNAEIAARPAAQSPATLGEIWSTEWRASGLDTLSGVGRPLREAYDELSEAYRSASGESVADAARRTGVALRGGHIGSAEAIRQLTGELDASQRAIVEPMLDVRGRARAKAAEIEKQAAEISDRTYGLSGAAVGFLAGVARQAVDPVNVATLPFGAARGASVLRMLGTEAGIGFGTQLAQEPVIQAGRAELGLEAGLSQALTNAFQAGIGAAGFAGLLRGAGFVLRKGWEAGFGERAAGAAEAGPAVRLEAEPAPLAPARLEPVAAREVDAGLRDTLAEIAPEDFEAVARLVERDALIDAASPFAGDEGRLLHREAVDLATSALESGRIAELVETVDPPAPRQTEASAVRALAGAEADLDADLPPIRRTGARAQVKPLSLSQFIARNGGLELTGDASHAGFDKVFVPGGGPLARKSGRSIDGFWRERLMEEGYLRKDDDGSMSRDIRAELFELLDNEQRGGVKTYRQADQRVVGEAQDAAAYEAGQAAYERDLEAHADRVRQDYAALEMGDLDSRALYDAAELMLRGEVDNPLDALERAFIRRELAGELSPQARVDYDLPDFDGAFDEVHAGTAQPLRGEAGREGQGRAEQGRPQGSGGAGGDGPRAGEGGGVAGGLQNPRLDLDRDAEAAARLADVARALDAAGGDLDLYIAGPDGEFVKTGARAHFDRLAADADAAAELKACLGQAGGAR